MDRDVAADRKRMRCNIEQSSHPKISGLSICQWDQSECDGLVTILGKTKRDLLKWRETLGRDQINSCQLLSGSCKCQKGILTPRDLARAANIKAKKLETGGRLKSPVLLEESECALLKTG
ncbi:hypothetical protein BaRGS_00028460 [Batillaria attramentaria]|uniref:Uncharacterized protein n=1 Tax=Batillaria attramentaria TaxID=370345 RepID=A0ABD0JZ05_9CAEN